jgi:hypothetical protein
VEVTILPAHAGAVVIVTPQPVIGRLPGGRVSSEVCQHRNMQKMQYATAYRTRFFLANVLEM